MQIKRLDIIHYPPGGSAWESIETAMPDWQIIESAIRRLNRDEWPFLWLHTNPPVGDASPDNMLSVMGGCGEYRISLLISDGVSDSEIYYFDPSRGSSTVQVWKSDQGFEASEDELCNDIERVLLIARYFADNAKISPDAYWLDDGGELIHEPGKP